MAKWVIENWFTILSAIGIIGGLVGLLFTVASIRAGTRATRNANLLSLTQSHRELWSQLFDHPELRRVRDKDANIEAKPITGEEEMFVNFVIQHLNSARHAIADKLTVKPQGLSRDVGQFFSLPIPAAVWKKVKTLQDRGLIEFVERCQRITMTALVGTKTAHHH